MPGEEPDSNFPGEPGSDIEPLEETRSNYAEGEAGSDTLGPPLGQTVHVSDPPPTSEALPPPLPAPKKRFFRGR
jgi:hypothetical protein